MERWRATPNIMQTVRIPTRMDAVQAPIIAVIGGLIRQSPGTISLGQGVVHYGPPQAALDAVRDALSDASTHEYQDGAGLPALVERLSAKLSAASVSGSFEPVICLTHGVAGMPQDVKGVRIVELGDLLKDLVTRPRILEHSRVERAARVLGVQIAGDRKRHFA